MEGDQRRNTLEVLQKKIMRASAREHAFQMTAGASAKEHAFQRSKQELVLERMLSRSMN